MSSGMATFGLKVQQPDVVGRGESEERLHEVLWFLTGREPDPSRTSQTHCPPLDSLHAYNARLAACDATFDARTDNLLQFLDRIAKDIGSTSAAIKDRAEQYHSGWFDTRADDIFMHARGQLYACRACLVMRRPISARTRCEHAIVCSHSGCDRVRSPPAASVQRPTPVWSESAGRRDLGPAACQT